MTNSKEPIKRKKSLSKKIVKIIFGVVINLLVIFILFEIVLRIFPAIIPIDMLYNFQKEIRSEIANSRHLATRDDFMFFKTDDGLEVRVFKPLTKLTYEANDPGMIPTVNMDEIGFCNPKGSYAIPLINIVTIGDSLTWCTNVNPEDTWTNKLGQLTGLSVYDLGVPGIGLYEYLEILKRFGIQKSPQVVIMGFCEGNDLRDALNYRSKQKDRLTLLQKNIYSSLASSWLGRNSYAFNLALATGRNFYHGNQSKQTKSGPEINFHYGIELSEEVIPFNPENTDRDEVLHAQRLYDQEISLEVFMPALRAYVELSQMHDFLPVVAYLPSAHTVYSDNVTFDDAALHKFMPWYSSKLRNFLQEKEKELGYILIDITPNLQKAAQSNSPSQLLYYQSNLHFTKHGHLVIAEKLNKILRDLINMPMKGN